jgi:NitT/TauT family transport system permease protein
VTRSVASRQDLAGAQGPDDSVSVDYVVQRRDVPRWVVLAGQISVLVIFLAVWEWAPEWNFASSHIGFLSRFDISSPQAVGEEIYNLLTGSKSGVPFVWPYLWHTVESTILGVAIGMGLGIAVGVLFSEFPHLAKVFFPYIHLFNSTPRIALIPIIIIIAGPTLRASVITSVLLIFFLGFFNAYEGAMSVSESTINSSRLLGAKRHHLSTTLRLPQALVWSFGVLPNAISFSLIATVATELLTGARGMGELVLSASSQLNAQLSFALVIILCIVGTIFISLGIGLRRVALKWEAKGNS